MAAKSKFQISRSLDERIQRFIRNREDADICSPVVQILGFNCANVTSYLGLTNNHKQHDSGLSVLGLCIRDDLHADLSKLSEILESIRGHYYASIGNYSKIDKNDSIYLICSEDKASGTIDKRLYDLNKAQFVTEQPTITILDDSKIYMHSAQIKLTSIINLAIYDQKSGLLVSKTTIEEVLDDVQKRLKKYMCVHLEKSNFSAKCPSDNKSPFETVYSNLDVPPEVTSQGDYLPQMTRADKLKLLTKWRNKMKDQRAPLEFIIDSDEITTSSDSPAPLGLYKLKIELFHYLQVNDPISKCLRQILYCLSQQLELVKIALLSHRDQTDILESDEIKLCTFKPTDLNHYVQAVYLIPSGRNPDYEVLRKSRIELHRAYIIPDDKPAVRYSQRIVSLDLKNRDQLNGYLCNVHHTIADKSGVKGSTLHEIVTGTYTYHHYMQDRISDTGWGCAYRSLQTIISWFKHQGYLYSPDVELRASEKTDKTTDLRKKLSQEARVPTHEEIQQVLVDVGDKQSSFIGSQKWIGSQEVCFVLSHLYNIESKFISVSSGSELVYKARELGQHFSSQSTPVMIGGGVLAHTVIGVAFNEKNGDVSYLILDPHYTGAEDINAIIKKGWCGWKKNTFWDKNSFYNLCLPQMPNEF